MLHHNLTQRNATQHNPTQCNATRHGARRCNPTQGHTTRPNLQHPKPAPSPANLPQSPSNLPKVPLPQAAHLPAPPPPRPHTTPRGTSSPVPPRLGRGLMVRCEDGLTGPPRTSTRCECSCWCAGWVGVCGRELCQGLKPTWDCVGRTLPCHQRGWQRGQSRVRAATELLAPGPVPVPPVGRRRKR